MSDSTERVERHKVVGVDEDQQIVYYRRNGRVCQIAWGPRFGTFPQLNDTLKLTFGGHSIHARLKKIERCGRERKTRNFFRRLFRCETPASASDDDDALDLGEVVVEY